ncbi:prepilin-type N-terminal cleavage/methylation domain-containing protein [Siccirubricoccus sp. G192]|uniref:prepilin-type N-terminal cleavage/methylation domain-containing protein n=1 Tax=Siccirubricoccus sp. G192 TaxID=2849651 RepID=UPI001C2C71F5|nr:prepilin-type N-terminal cleavage/methylation domain-containing protein [Siccirubricoccus sp. G192]MBV1800143.1 prepilin-type N-terminal cleavage/methylation domain-containing protein [Siccirubricoccus sp. G192]
MRASPLRAPGFTLLETLVVLLILSLAATALPRLWGAGHGGLVRAAAEDAAAMLREARLAARGGGREARVVFDTALGSFRRAEGGRTGRVPQGAALLVEGAAAEADADGRIAIRFDAEGGSTGGRVRVALGALSSAVEVDWLTGHVRARP